MSSVINATGQAPVSITTGYGVISGPIGPTGSIALDPSVINVRRTVIAASTANVVGTYSNGSSGVGATLTNNGAQFAFTIDGVSFSVGDRVLLWKQTTTSQNGIYTVTTVGGVSVNWVLTRATDFDGSIANSIVLGAVAFVAKGTLYAGCTMVQTTLWTSGVVGTTAITWITVANSVTLGGTGVTSFTNAYGLLFAGTTTTGPMQNLLGYIRSLVNVGSSGYGGVYNSGYTGGLGGFSLPIGKNMLWNGGFNVCQRYGDPYAGNVVISIPASTIQYTADRWQVKTNASQACTVTIGTKQNLSGASGGPQVCTMRIQRNSGQTGTGVIRVCQSLTKDQTMLAGIGSVLVSFYATAGGNFSPSSGTVTVTVYTGTSTTDMSGIGGAFTGSATLAGTFTLAQGAGGFQKLFLGCGNSTTTQIALEISWTPVGTAGANDYLDIVGIQMEPSGASSSGTAAPSLFEFMPVAQERARCEYFYRKSFALNTVPAQNIGTGTGEIIFPATATAALTNRSQTVSYPRMRTNGGTITIFSTSAASAQVYDQTAAGVCTSTAIVNQSDSGFSITAVGNASTVPGNALGFHYVNDNELT